MKYQLLFFLFALFCFGACDKDEPVEATNGTALPYPPAGLEENDLFSENDCSLPECSDERVVRFLANEVEGELYKDLSGNFKVRYTAPTDTSFELYFCDLPEEFQEEGLLISFDGRIIDACGIRNPVLGGQSFYTVQLTRIEKQG